ncbi:MAG: hemerythrin domain-containing protein [Acidimicrobiia bacterium]|nr:hemerythrin domain-containing protein [Acidimicrobiia bacterium]
MGPWSLAAGTIGAHNRAVLQDALSLHRLGESHRALLADVAVLDELAVELLDGREPGDLTKLDEALVLLRGRLTAHMDLEERVVYPAIAAELAVPGAMEWMIEDHREIRQWVDDLGRGRAELDTGDSAPIEPVRRALYVLGALVHLHLRKEEATYAWLLERQLQPRPA